MRKDGGFTMRTDWEAVEQLILRPEAAFSIHSKGRLRPEEPCPIRTCYQRDRDRIIPVSYTHLPCSCRFW